MSLLAKKIKFTKSRQVLNNFLGFNARVDTLTLSRLLNIQTSACVQAVC